MLRMAWPSRRATDSATSFLHAAFSGGRGIVLVTMNFSMADCSMRWMAGPENSPCTAQAQTRSIGSKGRCRTSGEGALQAAQGGFVGGVLRPCLLQVDGLAFQVGQFAAGDGAADGSGEGKSGHRSPVGEL